MQEGGVHGQQSAPHSSRMRRFSFEMRENARITCSEADARPMRASMRAALLTQRGPAKQSPKCFCWGLKRVSPQSVIHVLHLWSAGKQHNSAGWIVTPPLYQPTWMPVHHEMGIQVSSHSNWLRDRPKLEAHGAKGGYGPVRPVAHRHVSATGQNLNA